MDVFFKQSGDPFEKMNNVFIGNANDIKNIPAWKAAVRNFMEKHAGKIREVNTFNKGFTTVTMERHWQALVFELRPLQAEIMGINVTISRTPFPVLRTPADVVIDGFTLGDRIGVLEIIGREGGPIRYVDFVIRMSRVAAIVTFVRYEDAKRLVGMRTLHLTRENSYMESTLNVDWAKDANTRKEKRIDSAANAPANDTTALSDKLMELEKWRKEEKKDNEEILAILKEERLQERKEDQLVTIQILADLQERLLNAMNCTLSLAADKQANVTKLSSALSDLRFAKTTITVQISNYTAGFTSGSSEKAIEELKQLRTELEEEIIKLDKRLDAVLAEKVAPPALPRPNMNLLEGYKQTAATTQAPVLKQISGPKPKTKRTKKKRNEARVIPPHKPSLEEYTLALKGREGDIDNVATNAWDKLATELGGFLLMDNNEPIGFCEEAMDAGFKADIIGKLNSFVMVFRRAKCATKVTKFIDQVEAEVAVERNKKAKK